MKTRSAIRRFLPVLAAIVILGGLLNTGSAGATTPTVPIAHVASVTPNPTVGNLSVNHENLNVKITAFATGIQFYWWGTYYPGDEELATVITASRAVSQQFVHFQGSSSTYFDPLPPGEYTGGATLSAADGVSQSVIEFDLVVGTGNPPPSTCSGINNQQLSGQIRAIAIVPRNSCPGYWVSTNQGDVGSFGSAAALGGLRGIALHAPIVGMAATPSGNGYWLLAADGGIFTFGDATFHGSTGNIR
ncbi:MAG: hypothetical protein ACHQUB_01645, partial [Candidatus Saccharimonadia bacterium]